MSEETSRGHGWWYFSPRGNHKLVLGVSFFIHGSKEHLFFIVAEVPLGFEVTWRTPQVDLNRRVNLAREEEESLDYLLKCQTLASKLLCKEALVNACLSSMKLGGNFCLDLSFCFLYIGESMDSQLIVVSPLPCSC